MICCNGFANILCNKASYGDNLLRYLSQNTSSFGRPVLNANDSIELKLSLELQQIVSVDERGQSLTTKVWMRLTWINERVRWNPRKWGNVNEVNVNPDQIWTPDLVLYNNAEIGNSGTLEKFKTQVTMYSNGLTVWNAPATFQSTCEINVKFYPFDSQTCKLKFGSWVFDSSKLRLTVREMPIITKQYLQSSTWDVVEAKGEFHSIVYKCCLHPFHDVTYILVMKRRPMYYVVNIIAPCAVLVFIVAFSFMLPPESGERICINITGLLALEVFLQMVNQQLPQNSDTIPILSIFFTLIMLGSASVLVSSILVLGIHYKGKTRGVSRPPEWLRKLFPILNFGNDSKDPLLAKTILTKRDTGEKEISIGNALIDTKEEIRLPFSSHAYLEYTVHNLSMKVTEINNSMIKRSHQLNLENEWKLTGRILDRCFLLSFLFAFVMITIGTFIAILQPA